MVAARYLLFGCGLLGHVTLWIASFNRVHATPLPRKLIQALEKFHVLTAVAIFLWWIARVVLADFPSDPVGVLFSSRRWESAYFTGCCLFLAYAALRRGWQLACDRPPRLLLSNHTRHHDVAAAVDQPLAHGAITRALARVPGNQMLRLCVNEKTLEIARLSPRLDGLSIAHLSDLHFTGKIAPPYFQYVVDQANQLDADLAVVTGDIVDVARCVDWIPEVLGRLRARHGCYFILGNHDKRIRDIPGLRGTLERAGLIDLGSRHMSVPVRGGEILLAGNERPWFGPPPAPPTREVTDRTGMARVLLSHSPDQIPWARRMDFDLMLAGHTHGGQIRFPVLGPIVSPSLYGVKYASGVFYEAPVAVHVSRGVSGLDPMRWNCSPEVTKVVLRCSQSSLDVSSEF